MAIHQNVDRAFAAVALSAIQYFVNPSPKFLLGSAVVHLLDYQMRTRFSHFVAIKTNAQIEYKFNCFFKPLLSYAARTSFTHYALKQSLSAVIESMGYSSDSTRALTQSVLALASVSQFGFSGYNNEGLALAGNSVLATILAQTTYNLVYHYFEPKMEFKSLLTAFLVNSLTKFTINYLTVYANSTANNKPDLIDKTRLKTAVKYSAIELASSTIVLGATNCKISDASSKVIVAALDRGIREGAQHFGLL